MKIPFNPTNLQHRDVTKYRLHKGSVYDHTLATLRASKSNNPVVNIACLLHDCAKPLVKDIDEKGQTRYHGHDKKSVELIEDIAKRLKFSNEEKLAIQFAAEYHMSGHKFPEMKKSKVLNIRQNPNWDVLKQTIKADKASRGDIYDNQRFEDEMKYVEDMFTNFGEKQAFEKKMSAFIDGRMIMSLVDGISGQDIGKIKDATREWIISQNFNITKDEVVKYVQNAARQLGYSV